RVNDSVGHEAGDQVLRAIAALVQARTRAQDRFYRLGGEEFGLLLPSTGPDALREVAEKLRQAVEREVQCGGIPVTISLGAAPFRPSETAAEWLSRADAAMYEAKRSGRNRTVMAATSPLRARADTGQRRCTPFAPLAPLPRLQQESVLTALRTAASSAPGPPGSPSRAPARAGLRGPPGPTGANARGSTGSPPSARPPSPTGSRPHPARSPSSRPTPPAATTARPARSGPRAWTCGH